MILSRKYCNFHNFLFHYYMEKRKISAKKRTPSGVPFKILIIYSSCSKRCIKYAALIESAVAPVTVMQPYILVTSPSSS